MSTYEKAFLISGRNTLIHKNKKLDLIIVNEESDPVVVVTRNGVKKFDEKVPANRVEAKERYMEVVNVSGSEVFGETKILLFIQAINNKEYKIDYSKSDTDLFIRIHQESYI
ncbi:hypothetical protein [Rheinheimera sp. MMS21-TC3]|uniref:hypothetical protein n=1 Tax=Rheinheimera sp. MMS21-TC3 TaxID=3072790 RepID=UPI0028C40319|nr:hypothetical protein [Rheinheimera sp. MMS21-TC3]WNO61398.1 hypothetical protein RDV63_10680 [Rheinheimera sp. MMS21-TC3]